MIKAIIWIVKKVTNTKDHMDCEKGNKYNKKIENRNKSNKSAIPEETVLDLTKETSKDLCKDRDGSTNGGSVILLDNYTNAEDKV